MRKFRYGFLFVAVIAFLSGGLPISVSGASAASNWETVGASEFAEGRLNNEGMVFHNYEPWIAYVDQLTVPGEVVVMKYSGGSWQKVGVTGFTALIYSPGVKLVFSPATGEPYIAFSDSGNSGAATVLRNDGSNWVAVGSGAVSAASAGFFSLAFDGYGVPYMAYADGTTPKPTVKRYDGSAWQVVGSAGFGSGSVGQFLSLVIKDIESQPYIFTVLDGVSSVYGFDGTSWQATGSISQTDSTAGKVVSSSETSSLYIAFLSGSSAVTVLRYTGSTWVAVGTEGFSGNNVAGVDLKFDAWTNEPYVAFGAGGSGSQSLPQASVMRFDGSAWQPVGTVQTGYPAMAIALDFDTTTSDYTPYIAYSRDSHSGPEKITVEGYLSQVATPTVSPNGGSFSDTVTVTLADATAGAAIHYTIDGSTPTSGSSLYSAPFALSATTTVRAIGIRTGNNDSSIASVTFTKDSGSKKKKEENRVIRQSSSKVHRGDEMTQSGKRFAKNSTVKLSFEKTPGVYGSVIIKTDGHGKFSTTFMVDKPVGVYKWYAVDQKSGRKSATKKYYIQ